MKIGFASADRMTIRKITTCLLTLALASGASAAEVTIPAKLQPGPNEALVVSYAAKGVQVYECRAKKDASGYEWAFVAPEAELYDSRGQPVGRHGEGPFWRASDGSKIVGTVKERVDAPTA